LTIFTVIIPTSDLRCHAQGLNSYLELTLPRFAHARSRCFRFAPSLILWQQQDDLVDFEAFESKGKFGLGVGVWGLGFGVWVSRHWVWGFKLFDADSLGHSVV
jgi:hypothetical protein